MSKKDLFSTEAREKIKDLASSIDFHFLATDLKTQPLDAIPMSTKKVDDHGNIWLLSNKSSQHNQHIHQDPFVHLFYSNPSSMEYLNLFGEASIVTDRAILDDLYQSSDDAWFDGKDDPELTAIRIEPLDAHYWDTKHGKIVSLLKMGWGAVTGEKTELGNEGHLNV